MDRRLSRFAGSVFLCLASHKSAEPATPVVLMDFEQRNELIAAHPDLYYLKDHYVGYTCVLVRLSRIHPALRDILGAARRFVMPQRAQGNPVTAQRRRGF